MAMAAGEQIHRALTRVCIGVFLACLVAGSAGSARAQTTWPKKQWHRADPSEQGMDPSVLEALHKRMRRGDFGYVDQMIVIRNGHLVFDETYENDYLAANADRNPSPDQYDYYSPNWLPFYHGTDLHTMQSITKSITAAVVGVAVGRGDLPAVDTGVLDTFGEGRVAEVDDREGEMTGGVSQPLSHVVSEAAGEPIDEYAREYLFRPLGIKQFYWKKTTTGLPDTEGGLYMTGEDLARIGYLYLNDGMWNGTRILPEGWVQATSRPAVRSAWPSNRADDEDYGYQWWLVPYRGSRSSHFLAANGYGGQFLFVVPEKNLIAVFTGWNIYGPVPSIKDAFVNYVLRAVIR